MALLQRSASIAVFASLAVGLVVTLASGELRAERDVELELLRANEALAERLEQQEIEILALRRSVDAAAGKPWSATAG
jgi:hypothetical protein